MLPLLCFVAEKQSFSRMIHLHGITLSSSSLRFDIEDDEFDKWLIEDLSLKVLECLSGDIVAVGVAVVVFCC